MAVIGQVERLNKLEDIPCEPNDDKGRPNLIEPDLIEFAVALHVFSRGNEIERHHVTNLKTPPNHQFPKQAKRKEQSGKEGESERHVHA